MLPRLDAVRYVTPLREGGSLPAVVEADDGHSYVVKFRGAGQGVRALVAEAIAARLAHALDLPVPRAAVITLAEGFARGEPDPEIQDLLRASVGENFGLAYLAGALAFDPAADADAVDPDLAAAIVWLDACLSNVDRTPRNTNLLRHQGRLWLIDHGACLYFHHRAEGWQAHARAPFPLIAQHVLLPLAGDLRAADARLRPCLTDDVLRAALADVPDAWLDDGPDGPPPDARRAAYLAYLRARLEPPLPWLESALDARAQR